VCEETTGKEVGFEVPITANVKMTGYCDVAPCDHIEVQRYFGEMYCDRFPDTSD
jgi:hypothetical protein